MQRALRFIVVSFMISICPVVHAKDFNGAVAAASINIPPGADAASIGNSWAATADYSTNNPAAIVLANDFNVGLSGTYSLIKFDKGPAVNMGMATGTLKIPFGVLQLSYANGNSSQKLIADGTTEFKFKSFPSYDLKYGVQAGKNLLFDGDALSVGVGYGYSTSKTLMIENASIKPDAYRLNSRTETHSLNGGVVYSPVKALNFGGYFNHRFEQTDDDSIEAGVNVNSNRSHTDSNQVRLGFSWQASERIMLAGDYQHLSVSGSKFDQIFFGAGVGIIKDFLEVHGGWAADGFTAGLGLYFKNVGIDVAYMDNYSKDLKDAFGSSRLYSVSIYGNI